MTFVLPTPCKTDIPVHFFKLFILRMIHQLNIQSFSASLPLTVIDDFKKKRGSDSFIELAHYNCLALLLIWLLLKLQQSLPLKRDYHENIYFTFYKISWIISLRALVSTNKATELLILWLVCIEIRNVNDNVRVLRYCRPYAKKLDTCHKPPVIIKPFS